MKGETPKLGRMGGDGLIKTQDFIASVLDSQKNTRLECACFLYMRLIRNHLKRLMDILFVNVHREPWIHV